MRNLRLIVIVTFFVTISAVLVQKLAKDRTDQVLIKRALSNQALSFFDENVKALTEQQISAQADAIALQRAKIAEQRADIDAKIAFVPFKYRLKKISIVAYLGAGVFVVCVLGMSAGLVIVKRGTVFHATVNGSTYPVRHKDLTSVMPALLGSVQAQIQAALAVNDDAAHERSRAILADMATLYKAIGGKRGLGTNTIDISPAQEAPALAPTMPTFREAAAAFKSGEILTGYDGKTPVYIPLTGMVSAAVGGESGSGKTSKLRFLLAQLAVNGVHLSILDAHKGTPESLVDSLGALAHLPNVRVFDPFEMREAVKMMLGEVQAAIDSKTPADPPRVYVLDELRPINRMCPDTELLMDKLANEGRKFKFYGMFSSQTWEASMFKQAGSAARDACVLKVAARMPKQQARILMQDNDAARKVAKLTTPEMYVSSVRFNGVVSVPFAAPADMDVIAQEYHAQRQQAVNASECPSTVAPFASVKNNVVLFPTKPPEPVQKPGEGVVLDTLRRLCDNRPEGQSKNQWQQAVAERSGVSFSLIKNIMAGYANISEETAQKLQSIIEA